MTEFQKTLLILHASLATLAAGTVFINSLALVMVRRLPEGAQQDGVIRLTTLIHQWVYYPLLAAALLSGLYLTQVTGALAEGKWLHWKLLMVVLLAGLGLLVGRQLRSGRFAKPVSLLVHIAAFAVVYSILHLALLKPY